MKPTDQAARVDESGDEDIGRHFRYIVAAGRQRLAGPFTFKWEAARLAMSIKGATVERVPV